MLEESGGMCPAFAVLKLFPRTNSLCCQFPEKCSLILGHSPYPRSGQAVAEMNVDLSQVSRRPGNRGCQFQHQCLDLQGPWHFCRYLFGEMAGQQQRLCNLL